MLVAMRPEDVGDLTTFLRRADLSISGLGADAVHLWIERDDAQTIVASTGYEVGRDGADALIRSVAVNESLRRTGRGTQLALFAIEHARSAGMRRAWLFSRRSGPFWQGLGFTRTTTAALAAALPETHQVRLFELTGQLAHEVAWTREL